MKRVLYICNVGWFFISHRLELATEAARRGYDVHVACDIEDQAEERQIRQAGLQFHRIRLSRGGVNPFQEMRTFGSICLLVRRLRPQLIHNISIKPVIYGTLAARMMFVGAIVNTFSGLGYVFTIENRRKHLRKIVERLAGFALGGRQVIAIVQNESDRDQLLTSRVLESNQVVLIPGSGVDLKRFAFSPEPPSPPVRVLLPARLLTDKGILEFAEAAAGLKISDPEVECLIAGGHDISNPAALTDSQIRDLDAGDAINRLGHVEDVAALMRSCHIVCLPSYREGLPKALIEACAVGRAIVTSDAPGCRHVVTNGENGLLVPAKNAAALRAALATLARDRDMRIKMGQRGRQIAESRYGLPSIIDATLAIYSTMLPN